MNHPPRTLPISNDKWWLQGYPGFNPQLPNSQFENNRFSPEEIDGSDEKKKKMKGCLALQFDDWRELGFLVSERPCLEFLQNCDLPPPANKVFGGDKDTDSASPFDSITDGLPPSKWRSATDVGFDKELGDVKKVAGVLKALQLSQTRAREAEKKASLITAEKDHLIALFFNQSSQLFAYREWVKLLEIEVSKLKSQGNFTCRHLSPAQISSSKQKEKQNLKKMKKKKQSGTGGGESRATWCLALCLCLGIASVSLVLGWRGGGGGDFFPMDLKRNTCFSQLHNCTQLRHF